MGIKIEVLHTHTILRYADRRAKIKNLSKLSNRAEIA